jgi:hypothetical protein
VGLRLKRLSAGEFRRCALKASLLYRIASILLVFFAIGHTLGFRRTKPEWGVEALITSMRQTHFVVDGFGRTYWNFYVGFGLFVSVLLLFAALVAWQLGGLPASAWQLMRGTAWALAICFVIVTFLSWRYFFIAPIVFSVVITACLIAAAWLAGRPAQG